MGFNQHGSTDRPELSLIIPAYNEAKRIAHTVREVEHYFSNQHYPAELIIVDDGSTDETASRALTAFAGALPAQVITIVHGGKAAAVRTGMRAARGQTVAFSDVDLATPLGYLADLRDALESGCGAAIASREGIGAVRIGEPTYRHIMGRIFNGLVRILLLPGIQDTQCGFKLFSADMVQRILVKSKLYVDAQEVAGPRVTAFDVEQLVIVRRSGQMICSVPVVWTHGVQSKVNPLSDSLRNLWDVLRVRIYVWRGAYD